MQVKYACCQKRDFDVIPRRKQLGPLGIAAHFSPNDEVGPPPFLPRTAVYAGRYSPHYKRYFVRGKLIIKLGDRIIIRSPVIARFMPEFCEA